MTPSAPVENARYLARRLYEEGRSVTSIATALDVSRVTIYKWLVDEGIVIARDHEESIEDAIARLQSEADDAG